jgi:hypothetical protein|tara:strand:- start:2516 stop:2665 length:150 start_codon:yes stop_codon:yes gene_type:complete
MAFVQLILNYGNPALADRGKSQKPLEPHHDRHQLTDITALNAIDKPNLA